MNILDALKTAINGLTQKDESTIASTDLVQLYAQDGTPNGKISKAGLMDAVKASLPALLSDGSTNRGSVLSIIGGALKTRTDANLASVLGVRNAAIPTRTELAKKVATIVLNNDYSRVGFLFAVGGYGVMAMGVVSLRTSGNRTSPTANIIKTVLDSTQCKFIVVKEEASATST